MRDMTEAAVLALVEEPTAAAHLFIIVLPEQTAGTAVGTRWPPSEPEDERLG